MPRGVIDLDGMAAERRGTLARQTPSDLPFSIGRLGHVVLRVADLQRSVDFYTQVLGFRITDIYPDTMMSGRMVFMRCASDHHTLALIGEAGEQAGGQALHHFAFELGSLDEVFAARRHLQRHGVAIDFQGRRRAGCQVAVEFRDPDGNNVELYWGLDQVDESGALRPPQEWREAFSLEAAVDAAPPGQDTTLRDPGLRDG